MGCLSDRLSAILIETGYQSQNYPYKQVDNTNNTGTDHKNMSSQIHYTSEISLHKVWNQ